jgi:hypothetical protein
MTSSFDKGIKNDLSGFLTYVISIVARFIVEIYFAVEDIFWFIKVIPVSMLLLKVVVHQNKIMIWKIS